MSTLIPGRVVLTERNGWKLLRVDSDGEGNVGQPAADLEFPVDFCLVVGAGGNNCFFQFHLADACVDLDSVDVFERDYCSGLGRFAGNLGGDVDGNTLSRDRRRRGRQGEPAARPLDVRGLERGQQWGDVGGGLLKFVEGHLFAFGNDSGQIVRIDRLSSGLNREVADCGQR